MQHKWLISLSLGLLIVACQQSGTSTTTSSILNPQLTGVKIQVAADGYNILDIFVK